MKWSNLFYNNDSIVMIRFSVIYKRLKKLEEPVKLLISLSVMYISRISFFNQSRRFPRQKKLCQKCHKTY